eukprot:208167-Rhodomonas_salina.2
MAAGMAGRTSDFSSITQRMLELSQVAAMQQQQQQQQQVQQQQQQQQPQQARMAFAEAYPPQQDQSAFQTVQRMPDLSAIQSGVTQPLNFGTFDPTQAKAFQDQQWQQNLTDIRQFQQTDAMKGFYPQDTSRYRAPTVPVPVGPDVRADGSNMVISHAYLGGSGSAQLATTGASANFSSAREPQGWEVQAQAQTQALPVEA